jgi:hypothetical protein
MAARTTWKPAGPGAAVQLVEAPRMLRRPADSSPRF